MNMKAPLLMTEEYWASTYLSVARHSGGISVFGQNYIIVDKEGRDLMELSIMAHRKCKSSCYLIAPGEPCDLIDVRLQPSYKRLGRDRIIALLSAGATLNDIKHTKE